MPYVEPTSRATGYLVTAANWNQDVVANVSFLANPPACRVYNSANLAVVNAGSGSVLTFNSERFDTNTMHSTSSNTDRITVNTAGLYQVTFSGTWATAASSTRVFELWNSSAGRIGSAALVGTELSATVTALWKASAGQFFYVIAYQTSGGGLNVNAVANTSPEFSAVWVG